MNSKTWKWLVGILLTIVMTLATAWARTVDERTAQIPAHAERIRAVETEVSGVTGRLDRIETKLDRVLERR